MFSYGLGCSGGVLNPDNPHNRMTIRNVLLQHGSFSKIELVSWAFAQEGFTPAEKLTLIGLIWYCNQDGLCALSNAHLGEKVGLSPFTISKAIKTLSLNGFVKNTRRFNNSSTRKLLIDNLILDKY